MDDFMQNSHEVLRSDACAPRGHCSIWHHLPFFVQIKKNGGHSMRFFIAAALAASLIATNLLAAESVGPLAPGKPAGVKNAQDTAFPAWWLFGGAAAIALAVVATNGGCSVCTAPAPPTAVTSTAAAATST
jgi:hypothetical protein